MANRLANATSPYLQQHAGNPVDWWEWGPEAFEEARRRDVPILLSVGYAACHWCHVMAHESFEDAHVGEVLRRGFVAVKVDREERPDVDAVYMAATQALTGAGGWPMTCLLTPDGRPFFAGTYLPRAQLLALLEAAGHAWQAQRADVEAASTRITEALRSAGAPHSRDLDESMLAGAVVALRREFDPVHGGFGGAPKFPPSTVLEFLLRHHARTGDAEALVMAERSCAAMAHGGIYDQLAGGFARYAVDAAWVVPHFEKMLCDNALLARVYLHLWRLTGSPWAARVAVETADFIVDALGTPQGGFASALDADTTLEGRHHEGLTYVWTPAELTRVLGPDDGAAAAALLSVTDEGTFEHGTSTLQLRQEPGDPTWWERTRATLLAARRQRPQPTRDDKVVTAWNGLAIAALAEVGMLLHRPDLVTAASGCADLLLSRHLVDGRLRRVSLDGSVGEAMALLDDHGDLAEGLLALHQATGAPGWLRAATHIVGLALKHFRGPDGVWHDTADDAERLLTRPRSDTEGAEPGGPASIAGALLTLGALTGSTQHADAARSAVDALGGIASAAPRFTGWALSVAEAMAVGPLQVAVVGSGPSADDLALTARRSPSPGLVLVQGDPDADGIPLLADRPLLTGRATAYVCRGFVCDAPVTDVEALRAALRPQR